MVVGESSIITSILFSRISFILGGFVNIILSYSILFCKSQFKVHSFTLSPFIVPFSAVLCRADIIKILFPSALNFCITSLANFLVGSFLHNLKNIPLYNY